MRFAIIAAGVLAASSVVLSGNTARADATPTGVEVGLRTGYAIPLGDLQGAAAGGQPAPALGDEVSGMVPFWVDAGYRLNPNMMVGAFFQYGIAFVNTSKAFGGACNGGSSSCSANDLMFGAQFHYHLMPDQTIDPWAGIGIGYEILNGSATVGGVNGGGSYSGFQFVNLQVGGDYKVMPNLGVGPFVALSLGEYSSCSFSAGGNCSINSTSMHEWLTFGIRGAYDINL